MSNIYDAFETDDPDQMSDILLATIGELIEADRAGDGPIIEELWEKVEEMINSLVEAVQSCYYVDKIGGYMNCTELLDKYWSCFGHLDLAIGETVTIEDMVGSEQFSQEEAEQITKCLEDC